MAIDAAANIKGFHDNMVLQVSQSIPVYYMRYEDLVTKPQEVLEGLFCFLMNVKSIEGLNI